MSAKNAKQFVFRYDGIAASDEIVEDLDGVLQTPEKDHIIHCKNRPWKVVHVITQISGSGAIPVVRVFLTDEL